MNVIKKILTTDKYRNVRTILEMKQVLLELINYEIDMNDKNASRTFQKHINNKIKEVMINVPYQIENNNIAIDRWFNTFDRTTFDTRHIYGEPLHTRRSSVCTNDLGRIINDLSNSIQLNATNIDELISSKPNRETTNM